MKRLESRYNRLFKKTHSFVPKRIFQVIAESHRLRLEMIEKRDGLEARVVFLRELFEEAYRTKDEILRKEFADLCWADEEARLTYYGEIYIHLAKSDGAGLWFENSLAKTFLELATTAEADIKRISEGKVNQQHKESL